MTKLEEQRIYAGWPSKRETLTYYLEDLESKLQQLDKTRSHDPYDESFDRTFYSYARYHYYEVLWAKHITVQDILYAIAEVREKLRLLDEEEGLNNVSQEEQILEGQVVLVGFTDPSAYIAESLAMVS